jgi:hypothetical protein
MGGPVHASSATERLPPSSRFFEGWELVRPENRNLRATFTNCQIAKIVTAEQPIGNRPADDYCFTGVADALARALVSSSGLNPKGPGLLLYATWPVASIN